MPAFPGARHSGALRNIFYGGRALYHHRGSKLGKFILSKFSMPHSVRKRKAKGNGGTPKRRRTSSSRSPSVRFAGTPRRRRSSIRRLRGPRRGKDNQLASGSDVSGYSHTIPGRVSKRKFAFISAVNQFRNDYSMRLATTGGLQGVDLIGYNGVTGDVSTSGLFCFKDIVAIRNALGTMQTTTSVGVNNATNFAIPVGKVEYMITNSTNANIIVWLYDMIPRRTILTTDTAIQTPQVAWITGMSGQTGTGGGADVNTKPFAKPFESKLFCEAYRVVKVSKITLSPGVFHRHIVKQKCRRWFSDTQFNNLVAAGVLSSTALWYGGRTILTMAVIIGTPGHSAAAADTAHVSTAPAAIDVTTNKTYEFMWSATAVKQVIWGNAIPAAAADLEAVPEAGGGFGQIRIT